MTTDSATDLTIDLTPNSTTDLTIDLTPALTRPPFKSPPPPPGTSPKDAPPLLRSPTGRNFSLAGRTAGLPEPLPDYLSNRTPSPPRRPFFAALARFCRQGDSRAHASYTSTARSLTTYALTTNTLTTYALTTNTLTTYALTTNALTTHSTPCRPMRWAPFATAAGSTATRRCTADLTTN